MSSSPSQPNNKKNAVDQAADFGKSVGNNPDHTQENAARDQARSASFGVVNSGGANGRSREQIENDIFHGIMNQAGVDEEARRLEAEKQRRLREEILAGIRGARESEISTGKKTPGRSQVLLAGGSSRPASFLSGSGA